MLLGLVTVIWYSVHCRPHAFGIIKKIMYILNYYFKVLKWWINNGSFTLVWGMWKTRRWKPTLLSRSGSVIYNFCWEKKKCNYQLDGNCHKWKMQYPYPVAVNKRYCSKNKQFMITAFVIMMLEKRTTMNKILHNSVRKMLLHYQYCLWQRSSIDFWSICFILYQMWQRMWAE